MEDASANTSVKNDVKNALCVCEMRRGGFGQHCHVNKGQYTPNTHREHINGTGPTNVIGYTFLIPPRK